MVNINNSSDDTAGTACGGACSLPSRQVRIEHHTNGTSYAYGSYGQALQYTTGSDPEHRFFSPVDLMKIALGACSSFSVERVLRAKKGKDIPFSIEVESPYDEANDRFNEFSLVVSITDSSIEESERHELEKAIEKEISSRCTIKHTYVQATPVSVRITF